MKPPRFEYRCPSTLTEACQLLENNRGMTKILAGGQSLMPMMNLRMMHPDLIIDINQIKDLDYLRVEGNTLAIGALTRHQVLYESDLVSRHCPLMSEAYRYVAHLPIRNRGTIGGNISHADPSSEMPAVLLACNATVKIASVAGIREVSMSDFLVGPLQTSVDSNEIVVEVRIPTHIDGDGWAFKEVSARKGDFAMGAVGTIVGVNKGVFSRVVIVAAGIEDRATRLPEVERMLIGQPTSNEIIAKAGGLAASLLHPDSSYQVSAEFKRSLVNTLVMRTLSEASARVKE